MIGKTKLTPEVRRRLVEVAREARELVYGSAECPEWGTTFAEIESESREVGCELMRLLLEQTNTQQAQKIPEGALQAESSEVATPIGMEDRTLETEAGAVSWKEPAVYLPKSRKAFFLQSKALGLGVDEELSPSVMRKTVHLGAKVFHERQIVRFVRRISQQEATFILENETSLLITLALQLRESVRTLWLCDEVQTLRIGVAIEETLINACYHGNLEPSSRGARPRRRSVSATGLRASAAIPICSTANHGSVSLRLAIAPMHDPR